MYTRQSNYWSLVGLVLTLVQAVCLGMCALPPTGRLDDDARCMVGRIEVVCDPATRPR